MEYKWVRAKLAGLALPAKFKRSSLWHVGGKEGVSFFQASCTVHVLLRRSLKLLGALADGTHLKPGGRRRGSADPPRFGWIREVTVTS